MTKTALQPQQVAELTKNCQCISYWCETCQTIEFDPTCAECETVLPKSDATCEGECWSNGVSEMSAIWYAYCQQSPSPVYLLVFDAIAGSMQRGQATIQDNEEPWLWMQPAGDWRQTWIYDPTTAALRVLFTSIHEGETLSDIARIVPLSGNADQEN